MWNSQKTIYNRRNGDIKEALHVLCRKGTIKDAVLVALELFESKSGSAVMDKLRMVAVMEKFPSGIQYIPWFNKVIKSWRGFTYHEQRSIIINATHCISKIPTNRHIPYLARVAEVEKNTLELKMANRVHYYLTRHQRKNDFPTPSDFRKETILKTLKKLVFGDEVGTPIQQALWSYFVDNMDTKPLSQYFMYALVALKFQETEYIPSLEPKVQNNVVSTKAILPDVVFNMNTKLGKEKKRGMVHLLQSMDSNRSKLKRKAHELILEDKKTKHNRKKIRIGFLDFTTFKKKKVISSKMIKVPHGKTPGIWEIQTDATYLLQGPYVVREDLDYQLKLDSQKPSYGLKKVGYEITRNTKFYWLTCPKYEGKPLHSSKSYSDTQWHSILQILIFRACKGCSESSLKNIIQLDSGEFLSVNEIKKSDRESNLLDFLFTKKPLNIFLDQMKNYIMNNKPNVDFIFKQHSQSLFNFNLNF